MHVQMHGISASARAMAIQEHRRVLISGVGRSISLLHFALCKGRSSLAGPISLTGRGVQQLPIFRGSIAGPAVDSA